MKFGLVVGGAASVLVGPAVMVIQPEARRDRALCGSREVWNGDGPAVMVERCDSQQRLEW